MACICKKSRRQITKEHAITLRMSLDESIEVVGVFVDELPSDCRSVCGGRHHRYCSFTGMRMKTYINNLRYRTGAEIIKAFSISSKEDIIKANACSADYVLLDHGPEEQANNLTGVF